MFNAHLYSGICECLLCPTQLRSAEEASQRGWLEAANPGAEDKIQLIEKEMKEQEMLIKGYQQVCP